MQKIKNLCTKHEEAIWGFLVWYWFNYGMYRISDDILRV